MQHVTTLDSKGESRSFPRSMFAGPSRLVKVMGRPHPAPPTAANARIYPSERGWSGRPWRALDNSPEP